MSEQTDSEDEKKTFLRKMEEVLGYFQTVDIKDTDEFPKGGHSYGKVNLLFCSPDRMCDMQNIPKWQRLVSHWGTDIRFSLLWACAWAMYLATRKRKFEAESGLSESDFLPFAESAHFDSEAWIYAKYHLDNAIFRLYSYREKIAWFLNSHAHLSFVDTEKERRFSFLKYLEATEKVMRPLHDLLQLFNFEKTQYLMKYYRNQFVHNDTPTVDWPKEPQAVMQKNYDVEGKLVSTATPRLALSPPDFKSDELRQDAIDVWEQFVEGTNRLDEYLNETYYSKTSSGKQTTP
jgi:hypothetical protein